MATDKVINKGKIESTQERTLTLSRDPNRAMQQMMETIDSLRQVYMEENAALKSADTKTFLKLQDRKISAARNYQSGAQQLLERKGDLGHIDIALKQQLKAKQDEFSGIMAENLKALDVLHNGVQRLNDRIMRSAREAVRHKNVNYSAGGRLNKNERSVSLGLSESV